jgi:uncharacterized protein YlxW (UPF0749 family)
MADSNVRSDASMSRPDASMSLIFDVVRNPQEPGYQSDHTPAGPWEKVLVFVVLAALGFGYVAAVAWLRQPSIAETAARALLEEDIVEQIALSSDLSDEIVALTEEVTELQTTLVNPVAPGLLEQIAADSLAAGTIPVTGPGLRITLDDSLAARMDPDGAPPSARVQDSDLRIVVNGLWQAGAEAIAINGQRLTTLSAIRSAGLAILVDLVALNAPYIIDVIGDAGQLQADFARAPAAAHLQLIETTYGIRTDMTVQSQLNLPGANMQLTTAQATAEGASR